MRLLAEGGLWSVVIITLIALGYVRALSGKRLHYRLVLAVAIGVIVASQFLQEPSVFRARVAASLEFWKWVALAMVPFAAYALGVRYLHGVAKKRSKE